MHHPKAQSCSSLDPGRTPRVLVPAYVYPDQAPAIWARMATELSGGHVVINVANGPGDRLDSTYLQAVRRLQAHGVTLSGYVDLCYGERPPREVVADAVTWIRRYGIAASFLDCAPSDPAHLGWTQQVVLSLRWAGVGLIVANHGICPAPGYLTTADLVLTFEGTWTDYLDQAPTHDTAPPPSPRLGHLIHGLPIEPEPRAAALTHVIARARRHGVGWVAAAAGGGAHEWEVPAWW
jgi:hypothetical protein